jgi:hypothetical protein
LRPITGVPGPYLRLAAAADVPSPSPTPTHVIHVPVVATDTDDACRRAMALALHLLSMDLVPGAVPHEITVTAADDDTHLRVVCGQPSRRGRPCEEPHGHRGDC